MRLALQPYPITFACLHELPPDFKRMGYRENVIDFVLLL